MNAVDTNILIYGFDVRDPGKQVVARHLVHSLPQGALIWQVASEFISVSQRLASQGLASYDPWVELKVFESMWSTVPPKWAALYRTEQLLGKYSLSFWDALLIGVCLEGGIQRLYSEDFSAYPRIDGLEIVNPFVP